MWIQYKTLVSDWSVLFIEAREFISSLAKLSHSLAEAPANWSMNVHPYLGWWSQMTIIFFKKNQMGWNYYINDPPVCHWFCLYVWWLKHVEPQFLMLKTHCLIVNPTYFTMFWWVDSLLPSGPCGPSCLRPAVAQGSREASKNAAVPTFWPQPVPGMELCKQKCLATIAVMSQNKFAATLTFARPKAVEGVRISICHTSM